jgi:hypothetical protein
MTLSACALPGLETTGTPRPALITPTQPQPLPATPTAFRPMVITATPPPGSVPAQATAVKPSTPPQPAVTPAKTQAAQPGGLVPTIYSLSGSPDIPAGIFPQIGIFQIGGGSSSATPPACANPPGQQSWCHALNGAALTIPTDFIGQACGFGTGPLSASVVLPDGTTRPANTSGEPPFCRTITYSPKPDDPLGVYQVTVNQGDSHLSDSFTLTLPTTPAGRLVNSCIWLAGLQNGQAVRIQAFGLVIPGPNDPIIDPSLATWRFLGEGSFIPASANALLVCPDNTITDRYPELAYLAYPPASQQIMAGEPDLLQQFQGNCANGPKSRLSAGKTARIVTKDLPLFSDPSLNTKSEVVLHQGAILSVLNGPVCPPQGPWTWQVKTQDGQTGWLAESDTTSYFLEPR